MSAACEALRSWVRADVLLARLERRLRAQGATFDDVDERMAAELGVPLEAWLGYLTVTHAADRYQHAARKKPGGDAERE